MKGPIMSKHALFFLLAITLAIGCTTTPGPVATPQPAAPPVIQPQPAMPSEPVLVTLDSPSPMVAIKIMVKAGYAADPAGKEGLANLVAESLIQGGFGTAADPTTKEELAEITQPWGDGARPRAQVAAETTTFHVTVPKDVLAEHVSKVLRPMLTSPLFLSEEIDRIKNEMMAVITSARYENLENLGLSAIDSFVNTGTPLEHQGFGTETAVPGLTREDVANFYRAWYRPGNVILGLSTDDSSVSSTVQGVVAAMNPGLTGPMPTVAMGKPAEIQGRHVLLIEEPNSPAASVHLGFPFEVTRDHPDFWPLYVANTWFGTHRDSFGHLYQLIRQERGYNYGDYSYIEHWNGRPFNLFQIYNQPRSRQYFSVWIRPVQHEYAYHLMKAATYELDDLVRNGLTADQVTDAKRKAKVLYVNLAETIDRLLAAKMDDAWYGTDTGFLEGYIEAIDRVTPEQVNAALRRHLQTSNLKYVVITDSAHLQETAALIRANRPSYGKVPATYQLEQVTLADGKKVWQVPDEKIDMLRLDGVWAHYPIDAREVRVVPVTSLFRTGKLVTE